MSTPADSQNALTGRPPVLASSAERNFFFFSTSLEIAFHDYIPSVIFGRPKSQFIEPGLDRRIIRTVNENAGRAVLGLC